jgi:hypothetical protein
MLLPLIDKGPQIAKNVAQLHAANARRDIKRQHIKFRVILVPVYALNSLMA